MKLSYIILFLLLVKQGVGQNPCFTDKLMSEYESSTIESQATKERIEKQYSRGVQYQTDVGTRSSLKVLPVVFHIITSDGSANVSDQEIIESIDLLNLAYSNQGQFTNDQGIDTDIQFCLAKRTPDNTQSSGINRVTSPLAEISSLSQDFDLKSLSRWNPRDYVNIWIVESINIDGTQQLGYAYLPYVHGSGVDGVVLSASVLDDLTRQVATFSHELGHS